MKKWILVVSAWAQCLTTYDSTVLVAHEYKVLLVLFCLFLSDTITSAKYLVVQL